MFRSRTATSLLQPRTQSRIRFESEQQRAFFRASFPRISRRPSLSVSPTADIHTGCHKSPPRRRRRTPAGACSGEGGGDHIRRRLPGLAQRPAAAAADGGSGDARPSGWVFIRTAPRRGAAHRGRRRGVWWPAGRSGCIGCNRDSQSHDFIRNTPNSKNTAAPRQPRTDWRCESAADGAW